jgi:hypothetical protein
VRRKIADRDLAGYWYIAEREKNYKHSKYWQQSPEERAKQLEALAGELSFT